MIFVNDIPNLNPTRVTNKNKIHFVFFVVEHTPDRLAGLSNTITMTTKTARTVI